MASELRPIWDELKMGQWRAAYVNAHQRRTPATEILKSLETIDWEDFEPSQVLNGYYDVLLLILYAV